MARESSLAMITSETFLLPCLHNGAGRGVKQGADIECDDAIHGNRLPELC